MWGSDSELTQYFTIVPERFTNLALWETKWCLVETPTSFVSWVWWLRKDSVVVFSGCQWGVVGVMDTGETERLLTSREFREGLVAEAEVEKKTTWEGVKMKHLGLTQEATHQRLTLPLSWLLPWNRIWESRDEDWRWLVQREHWDDRWSVGK